MPGDAEQVPIADRQQGGPGFLRACVEPVHTVVAERSRERLDVHRRRKETGPPGTRIEPGARLTWNTPVRHRCSEARSRARRQPASHGRRSSPAPAVRGEREDGPGAEGRTRDRLANRNPTSGRSPRPATPRSSSETPGLHETLNGQPRTKADPGGRTTAQRPARTGTGVPLIDVAMRGPRPGPKTTIPNRQRRQFGSAAGASELCNDDGPREPLATGFGRE